MILEITQPLPYFYGVAKKVCQEHWRTPAVPSFPAVPTIKEDREAWLERLDGALEQLQQTDRELILDYYREEGHRKINHRKAMATQLAVEPNVLPVNFRAKLLEFLQLQLTDPTGVREALVSEPRLQPFGNESRYVACLRYNSKNGYGQYTGVQEYVAIYFNGTLNQYVPAAPGQCTGAAYVPFPELERLKRITGAG